MVCSWGLLKFLVETAQQYDKGDENESDSCPEQDDYDSERFIDSSRNKITEAYIGPLINKVRKLYQCLGSHRLRIIFINNISRRNLARISFY